MTMAAVSLPLALADLLYNSPTTLTIRPLLPTATSPPTQRPVCLSALTVFGERSKGPVIKLETKHAQARKPLLQTDTVQVDGCPP